VDSWFFLSFPRFVDFAIAGLEKAENRKRGKCPPPDSDLFYWEMFFTENCTNLSSQASPNFHIGPRPTRVAASSSRKAINFSSARTIKRFPLSQCLLEFRKLTFTRLKSTGRLKRLSHSQTADPRP
jgi:hypothetical protein